MAIDTNESSSTAKKDQLKVLSIAEGFFQSTILFALLRLKVFEHIGEGTKSLEELAAGLKSRPETLARLLNAGVVLKLLESGDGKHYCVASSCRSVLLPSAGENYLGNWCRNLDSFRLALERLDKAVLTSSPTVDTTDYLGGDKERTREYVLAMHNYASLRGKELACFLDTSGCRTLLDLGCGPGTYAFHFGMRNPNLQLYLLDFPGVLEITREVRDLYSIGNQVQYLPLDALKDKIPGSYDIILVSNTMHMLGEKANRKLVSRLYRSVNPHGSLVIQAQFLRDDRMGERWPVLLDLIQLCITTDGRNHSVGETRQWMEEAGFKNIEHCPMTLLNTNSYLRGYKI
jgi:SAM-dependent methyltransferase